MLPIDKGWYTMGDGGVHKQLLKYEQEQVSKIHFDFFDDGADTEDLQMYCLTLISLKLQTARGGNGSGSVKRSLTFNEEKPAKSAKKKKPKLLKTNGKGTKLNVVSTTMSKSSQQSFGFKDGSKDVKNLDYRHLIREERQKLIMGRKCGCGTLNCSGAKAKPLSIEKTKELLMTVLSEASATLCSNPYTNSRPALSVITPDDLNASLFPISPDASPPDYSNANLFPVSPDASPPGSFYDPFDDSPRASYYDPFAGSPAGSPTGSPAVSPFGSPNGSFNASLTTSAWMELVNSYVTPVTLSYTGELAASSSAVAPNFSSLASPPASFDVASNVDYIALYENYFNADPGLVTYSQEVQHPVFTNEDLDISSESILNWELSDSSENFELSEASDVEEE